MVGPGLEVWHVKMSREADRCSHPPLPVDSPQGSEKIEELGEVGYRARQERRKDWDDPFA
jgi:hypothetical protein